MKSSYSLPVVVSDLSVAEKKFKKSVKVTKVQLKGNTALSKFLLKPIIQQVINKNASLTQLEQLRYEISKLYYDEGFINSGVVLPEQDFKNGLLVFVAIEGVLSDVKISGLSNEDAHRIRQNIIQSVGSPLNINQLQAELNKLNASRAVDKLHASFLQETMICFPFRQV